MTAATRTRPRIRKHLHVGLRVITRDGTTVERITQIWRADRQVQLTDRDGNRHTVTYSRLTRDYEAIQPW